MRALILALPLVLVPVAALAVDKPMTADEFDAYSQGKTLYYAVAGKPYGAESYMPGHKVVWAFLGEDCKTGTWYQQGDQICFLYDNDGHGPQCWTFFKSPAGLKAHFSGDAPGSDLIEVQQSPDPLQCPGPKVGV